jgi:hypothetical protein
MPNTLMLTPLATSPRVQCSTAGVPHHPAASVHATSVDSLKGRHHHLQAYVDALPKNVALRARLIAAGYSPGFWGTRVFSKLEVAMVDGSAESLHIALVPLYQRLVPLLRESGIFEVGGTVVSEAMFSVDLSSEMLRTKRAAAVHALQARYAETELSDAAEECTAAVTTMLADEQRIENAWRVQQAEGKSKQRTKVLTVDVIHTLMDCARACAKVTSVACNVYPVTPYPSRSRRALCCRVLLPRYIADPMTSVYGVQKAPHNVIFSAKAKGACLVGGRVLPTQWVSLRKTARDRSPS